MLFSLLFINLNKKKNHIFKIIVQAGAKVSVRTEASLGLCLGLLERASALVNL